jgi:hypothetical protein
MIPYEELCDALTRWRAKNGMVGGSAKPPATTATGPVPALTSAPASAPAAFVPSTTPAPLPPPPAAVMAAPPPGPRPPRTTGPISIFGDSAEATQVGGPPTPPAGPRATTAPDAHTADATMDADAPTGAHAHAHAKDDREPTSEIDIDGVDVIDEEPL